MPNVYDLAIIGGGINGCGIARDAAGRGLSVFLCEMGDLASGTSSRSTKLIHGGLRYLEQFDFRLVREALTEREVLWQIAPHIVRPLRFVLPYQEGLRPAWMLRVGLFLYDHLGGRKRLPGTRVLDLAADAAGAPLEPGTFTTGFEYSDCWVDDARLVVLNARDAADRGAAIRTRTRALEAVREAELWRLTVADVHTGATETSCRTHARQCRRTLGRGRGGREPPRQDARRTCAWCRARTSSSPSCSTHDRAYIFQNPDGRVVFAIPYEGDFTLIGTTDRDYPGDPAAVDRHAPRRSPICARRPAPAFARAGAPERRACGPIPACARSTTTAPARPRPPRATTCWRWTRGPGAAPLLSVIGGKITTYRRLAEAVLERLSAHLPAGQGQAAGWTGATPLPGGEFEPDELALLAARLVARYPS